MGWSSGTELAERFIKGIKKIGLDKNDKVKVYKAFIPPMLAADWDCEHEVEGLDPAFDIAMKELGYTREESDDE